MASMFDLVSFNALGLSCDKKRKKVFTMLKKQTSNNAVFLFKKVIAKEMLRNYGKSNGMEKCFTVMEPQVPEGSLLRLERI